MTQRYIREQHDPRPFDRKGRLFKCEQCSCKPDCPMLKHEVWDSIMPKDSLLCIYCTERMLGRRLTLDDLMPCVANNFVFYLEDVKNGVDKAPRLD